MADDAQRLADEDFAREQQFAEFGDMQQDDQQQLRPDSNNNLLGNQVIFARQQQARREENDRVRRSMIPMQACIFACCASILLIILVCLWVTTKDSDGCGVPLFIWFYVFFGIMLLNLVVDFSIVCCGGQNWATHKLISSCIFGLFLLIWFIYGWVIVASKDDDCGDHKDTKGWWIFLIIILVFFSIIFAILLCLLCCLCVILCFFANRESDENRLRGDQIQGVVSSLTRVNFDSNQHDNDCAICMCPFEADSQLTVLKCNPGHYFHNECIERWVQDGNNTCPHCREPIANIEEIRAMMEGGSWEFSSSENRNRSIRSIDQPEIVSEPSQISKQSSQSSRSQKQQNKKQSNQNSSQQKLNKKDVSKKKGDKKD